MRVASTSPRRAAGDFILSAQPAEPEPGSFRHAIQIMRGLTLDEIGAGVAFLLCIAVAFLALVVFG